MNYYLNLFSPDTYETFTRSGKKVSGFRIRHQSAAAKVHVGDRMLCYMTKLSRWIGILEVVSEAYNDPTPFYYEHDDPFIVRFEVKPIVWLSKEKAIPIKDDRVWNALSFTKNISRDSFVWTGKLRTSLVQFTSQDGAFLERILREQENSGQSYPVDEREYAKFVTHTVRRANKVVAVSVPQSSEGDAVAATEDLPEVRESTAIQALLADMGTKMGMKIWLPRSDRGAVMAERLVGSPPSLEVLPLNYDETTLKTIEQIDVLWLRGRAILRAFEVEHTTSIYSGILRMADLLALQPNMDIRLHIVAPVARREKVMQELRRPVFSLLEKGPLYESCTYLSYDSVREIAQLKHLAHVSDSILDEYAEYAEEPE